jgi:pimeloyl-ACP methyl ester carboxylesterase
VRFLGRVSPIGPAYERAALVVAPSFGEGFGMTALEAAERGRAVIASDIGGLPEIVEDRRTGLLVPPGDPDALAAAIVELLKKAGHPVEERDVRLDAPIKTVGAHVVRVHVFAERFVDVTEPSVRIRVVEVGSGEPIVFVPGTMVTGPAWGALVAELAGYRCLLIDRPGEGLSSPVTYPSGRYGATVSAVMRGLFDELKLERATVVGHSIGTVWALRAALALPSRVSRVVLLGGGPLVDDLEVPPFIARIASPLGAVMVRLPLSAERARSMMRDSGHAATLDAGGIPDELPNWLATFARDTPSMRYERAMVRTLVGRGRWKPGLTFDDRELAAIEAPVSWAVGSADPIGSIELWKRVAMRMRRAEITIVDNAGHLPWLDDPAAVADLVRQAIAVAHA